MTVSDQLIFLWIELCKPLETLQNLFEGCFYLEDLCIKAWVINSLPADISASMVQSANDDLMGLRTKEMVHIFNPNLGASLCSLT